MRSLLTHGAEVQPEDLGSVQQPIIKALLCEKESTKTDILKLLIQHGVDMNYSNGLPLQAAILSGNVEGVQELVAAGAELNSRVGADYYFCAREGLAMMHAACGDWAPNQCTGDDMTFDDVKKRMKILRILLEAGLNMVYYGLEDRDKLHPKYALHTVSGRRSQVSERMPVEMLKLLIYYGTDIDEEIN